MLSWISTGCYLPISQRIPESREYYPAQIENFTPDKTTREEVLLILGEPDEQASDGKVLLYNWSKMAGSFTITGCDAEGIKQTQSIKFTFDSVGILKSLDTSLKREIVPL